MTSPCLGLRTLLFAFIAIGSISSESEKDFEFAGEKASQYSDDEDFLADQEGSGETEGSGVEGIPPGVPSLYRAKVNVTNLSFTAEIQAARDERTVASLAITLQLQNAINALLASRLGGNIRIRIVDYEPGSLMVVFDIDTDGSQSEEEITAVLKEALRSGFLNGYNVSPEGFQFSLVRTGAADCAAVVGRKVEVQPRHANSNFAHLMVANSFPCNGFVVAWNYYSMDASTGYIGIFRQTSETEYTLVDYTAVTPDSVGPQKVLLTKPVLVQNGDFIGIFYHNITAYGSIGMIDRDTTAIPDARPDLFTTFQLRAYSDDFTNGAPFKMSDFSSTQMLSAFAVQAEMSYANVPVITTPPPAGCSSQQWKCRSGECIPREYRCDNQYDCTDDSDEEGCERVLECQEEEFRCASSGQCLSLELVCDFVDDCGDNSDELSCGPGQVLVTSYKDSSSPTEYTLSWARPQIGTITINRYTIKWRKVLVLDGRLTPDGNYMLDRALSQFWEVVLSPGQENYRITGLDPASFYQVEIAAVNDIGSSVPVAFIFRTDNAGCEPGQFQCRSGGCISNALYCDSNPDCPDDSDETDCVTPVLCPEGTIPCASPDNTTVCRLSSLGCECAEGEFQCLTGRKCISGTRRCDSRQDCADGSDEANCPCPTGTFTCLNTAKQECVDERLKCDNYNDCSDGSDELGCRKECGPNLWQCRDLSCVPASMRCDGVPQCEDGSDELECRKECRSDEFTCRDGNCVEGRMRCDGVPQCEDRSDEEGCRDEPPVASAGDDITERYRLNLVVTLDGTRSTDDKGIVKYVWSQVGAEDALSEGPVFRVPGLQIGLHEFSLVVQDARGQTNTDYVRVTIVGCRNNQYQCADGNCVEADMRCDGRPQCEDASDEVGCPTEPPVCPPSDFQCTTVRGIPECIDKALQCDGNRDCTNGFDEENCPGCPRNYFECKSDRRCIQGIYRCNGITDCIDRSDELGCVCTSEQFKCGDGLCIPLSRRCDRRVDCEDRSDELACPCRSGEFQCLNGDCILESDKCNGRYDCRDRSDETGCPLRCSPGEMECVVDNKCITADQICNRVYDCSDTRDELDCVRCTETEFQCESDRACISVVGRCNGRGECNDGSDERGCPTLPPITISVSPRQLRIRAGAEALLSCMATGLPSNARVEWFRTGGLPVQSAVEGGKLMIPVAKPMDSGDYICRVIGVPGELSETARLEVVPVGPDPDPDTGKCGRDEAVCQNGQCIRREYRCDGERDCTDGSDEPPDCYNNMCEPNEFQCPSGQCVMKIWRCDGEEDCDDGFDETNCQTKLPDEPCGTDEFQCVSGDQCVPLAYQCDQEIDCLDRSDEIGCTAPIITVLPVAEIEVELGGMFTIICEAVGVPTPLIVWRLNWGNIPSGDRVTVVSESGRGVLTVRDARYEDAGAYTCEAINNRGSIFAIPDALVIVTRQPGICSPPFFNSLADRSDQCVRCFCFGHTIQCFSSELQVSRISLVNKLQFVREEAPGGRTDPVDDTLVRYRQQTGEHEVLDITRNLPAGRYYWKLPREFLADRLTSYGGELKYTIFYEIGSREEFRISDVDVVIKGNGITLFYGAKTVPKPGVQTSISVPLIESAWERSDRAERRGDTPVDSQNADRADLMMVLADLEYILIRGKYDRQQTTSRIGGVSVTTAVNYPTDLGQAHLLEECTCPTGYTGLSCQNCADGFTRIKTGPYLGQCVACNCNGHSNDCDPYTGQCLNCRHNTMGPNCQLCQDGYYGDARRGTPNDCRPCPCPLTESPNQFSRTCFLDTDGEVSCAGCPPGYEGRRCEVCAPDFIGNPLTPGSTCRKKDDGVCDPRGSVSSQRNPLTGRCDCKKNVGGDRCDTCKPNTFYLSSSYDLGCVKCFCMGVSEDCQSTSWNRAQISMSFTQDASGVQIADMMATPLANQQLSVDRTSRELVYRGQTAEDTLYWSLPAVFLGDKVHSYGGALRFTLNFRSTPSDPIVKISGNDIDLLHRVQVNVEPRRPVAVSVMMYEQNWFRVDGQPATREHLLMALADLKYILIQARYSGGQEAAGLRDVSLDIAEDRVTQQERAYSVEQCRCPIGYKGLSCEDCDVGYTRSGEGIYLGLCVPCRCNSHSTECNPEDGTCRNCQHNTAGDHCEVCAVGYYGDATRGTRADCQKCPCPLTEAPNQFSPSCELIRPDLPALRGGVRCTACPAGHTGLNCETCVAGYTGNPMKVGDYCKLGPGRLCDCDQRGTVPNTECDEASRQCQCKPYVQGRDCARCREGHFYMEMDNPQGCLTCFCSGITNQCTSSNYYREGLRPQIGADGSHNFVLTNRRLNNLISDGFVVDANRNQVTYNRFEGVQQERESLFFQLPAKFRGDRVTAYGGYLRFTLEFSARPDGRMYRDVDLEIISAGQALRLYHLFEPSLEADKTQTYEILLRESSFNDLRTNTAPTRETFMTLLSNVEGILIRATYHQKMASVTLRAVSMDTAIPTPTMLGGAPMVEDCRCPEGYTGLSCERCADGYLRVSDGRDGLGRCVRCNCNKHANSCDPVSGRCLNCQHNTEGDRCDRCAAGYYGDATSGTPADCRPCPCPLTTAPNQFSPSCYLAEDKQVTCDRCAVGYTGRQCGQCAEGYVGNPTQPGGSCRPQEQDRRPDVVVTPLRLDEPEGSTVIFQCQVSGEGPFNVVWSRLDSRQLPDRATVGPRYTMTIRNVKLEDAGRYRCTATNRHGNTRREVELRVIGGQTPLQVRIDQTRIEIEEGQSARLVCTVISSPPGEMYILSWSKQGSLMPTKAIDQNGVLVIPNVQQSDAGNYICMGSNMNDMDEATAVIIVTEGKDQIPTGRIEPRYQYVDEGAQVRFECIVTGSPAPTVEWYRGGERSLNPEARVSGGVLSIPRAQLSDESDYYCRATNENGKTEIRTILYVKPDTQKQVTIIVRQTKYVVVAGDTARLECYAEEGGDRVTLFWSRQAGLPPGTLQSNGVLTIPNTQPSAAGRYICTGTDTDTGKISTAEAILEVNVVPTAVAPTVKMEPEKITIPMGTTGTLRCIATGTPQPTLTWSKSREQLSANHQVTGNILRITQATMADRGIYVCRAENSAGVAQDWTTVEVERRMRPKIDIYPNMTARVPVGASMMFQCRVLDGAPTPRVTWARTGGLAMSKRVKVMDNGVIMITQVTAEDQGSYVCTAENDMGVETITATLHVQGPPTISIQPSRTVYGIIGQRVTLECSATGHPIPTVQWIEPVRTSRGDVSLEGVYGSPPTPGSAVVDILNLQKSDEGTYICEATNAGGRTEDRVQLIVGQSSVGVSISGPSTLSVTEGQLVELVCTANQILNPVIRWRRREGTLPPGHSVQNGVLTLPRFRSDYAGEYICSTAVQTQTYEASVFIIVTVAPRLTISPQRITTRAGETVQLRCTATGSGPFNIEWSRVDAQMNPTAVERDGILEIRQVSAADAGRYRCVVQSSAGSSEGFAIVTVEVPPTVQVSQRDVYTESNRVASLRCEATGSPAPSVRWEKEGDQLPVQHRVQDGTLTIYNVKDEDAGRYICTASSSAGSARDYAVLHVSDGGSIDHGGEKSNVQVVNVGDRVSLECIVTGSPVPVITWSRADRQLPADSILGDGILIIPSARIEDAGTYTCKAENQAGSVSQHVVLYVRARPEVSAPSSARAALGDSVSLVCDAQGFPSPDITWYRKDGKEMPTDYTIVDGDLRINRVRPEDAGTYVCRAENEHGGTDRPVSLDVGALVPHFTQNPQSYIAYPPLNDVYLDFDILLSLRPESTEGMVLYNGQFEDGGGDFVCFGLNEGYPEFKFDVGSGPAIIRGNNTLGLNEWHTIKLTRNRKKGSMVVDSEPAYAGESPGYFTGLDLAGNMYLGSVPNYNNIPKVVGYREGFVGSISEVKIKGVDLNLGAEAVELVGVDQYNACNNSPCANGGQCLPANVRYGFKCLCAQGYTGARCEEVGEQCYPGVCGAEGRCYNLPGRGGFRCICPLGKTGTGCLTDVVVTNPFFNSTSFISYPPVNNAPFSLSIALEFKPQSLQDGIILYEGDNEDGTGDSMALVQKDGYLEFRFDTGSGPAVVRSRYPLRVNEWTRVRANRNNREGSLTINDEQPVTGASPGSTIGLNLKLPLYLGGVDPTIKVSPSAGVTRGFVGCVAELLINDERMNLHKDAVESLNVVDCGERRLCERKPCKNAGTCEDLPGPEYKCLCPPTHTGRSCEFELNMCLTNSPCQNGAPCSYRDDTYQCDCPLGFAGKDCQFEISLKDDYKFGGRSYLGLSKSLLAHSRTQERQNISFTMATTQSEGLVFWHGGALDQKLMGKDYMSIALKDGYLEYRFDMGTGPAMLRSRSRVNDGGQHMVVVDRLGRAGSLTVDTDETVHGTSQGPLQMLNVNGDIYFGGLSNLAFMTDNAHSENFEGCIGNINISGKRISLTEDVVGAYNLEACSP